jgi:hypothetical protein
MTIKTDIHGLAVQAARPATSQTLTVGAASVQSNPFQVATSPTGSYAGSPQAAGGPITTPNQTLHIRLVATADSWIAFGSNPTAAASGVGSIFLPAGVPEYFWVVPGERIAAIQNSAGGLLNVAEMVA